MRNRLRMAAALVAGLFVLGACGAPPGGTAATGPTGDPVTGGTGRIILSGGDPRGLDPALLSNQAAFNAALGNALYSQLLINDTATKKRTYVLAESLDTTDGGQTFTLKLRPGIVYSDGTPMTAEDVQYNWKHIADPATASAYGGNAREIASMTVVDDLTMTIALRSPNAQFADDVLDTAMNWIAKPETLQAGPDEFNARPIGAGPFTLEQWRRQDVITLVRNGKYFDGPRPYLDRLEIRILSDEEQRFNTVSSGGADIAQESQYTVLARAEQQGMQVVRAANGGGVVLVLNTKKAPFDDIRARQALSLAIDLNLVNDAMNEGTGIVPTTLFPGTSPYHADIPLHQHDPAKAQALLDEIAAGGTPLKFELTTYSSVANQRFAQSLQTQLSTLKNVTMTTRVIDTSQNGPILNGRDFHAILGSVPDTALWLRFRGGAGNNYSGVDDPKLNAALDDSRRTTDTAQIAADYKVVQERLNELTPVVFVSGLAQGAIANPKVGGLAIYGSGSLLPERLWIGK